ncbi:methyltransferase domain-containing protein [Helicobacter saguini]|uniref:Carboxy-S-adenosyl-L-methionine synthase n=1 Tax=Helicobacter saguini TaxID=1548018 RepID=A0A347VNP7_9HELI|nr:methyltransferase domain-containing protein [Helicobacter saguini]MWV61684.1 methyltransferase domain-containing protein [Helicobacter saguini]MWV67643.1 methyltransferase domain-containing protein [Helicobacter saguini]MWV69995.1 methyltransferase domain-containing protein [Helicobacter saguini]MWV72791.1 methyltransferase domain-containing protein [Helicobacter saguini]TLD92697.1 methyltransferase domain-containing protein [Helicobacter saguini]
MKDNIFTQDYNEKFEFNELVASVFDDMIERSIPFYDEILNIAIFFILQDLNSKNANLDSKEVIESSIIYDLGCSTGNLLLKLIESLKTDSKNSQDFIESSKRENSKNHNFEDSKTQPKKLQNLELIGIDNSPAMLTRARLKAKAMSANIEFKNADFLSFNFKKADIICAFYTLQFVRPLQRQDLIKKIYDALKSGGVFLFAEKVITTDSKLESQMISLYYEYKKKQGYTQGEIYKKREALENVLVPYSVAENISLLKTAGFTHIEILFKWVNFTLFFAKK